MGGENLRGMEAEPYGRRSILLAIFTMFYEVVLVFTFHLSQDSDFLFNEFFPFGATFILLIN